MSYSIIIFLFINSLKIYLIENFILSSLFLVPLNNIILYKFIFIFTLNLIIILVILRLKSRIILSLFYLLQTIYLLTHLVYSLHLNSLFHVQQFIYQFPEGYEIVRNFAIPWNINYLIIFLDMPIIIFIIIDFSKVLNFTIANKKIISIARVIFWVAVIFFVPLIYKTNIIKLYLEERPKAEIEIVRNYGLAANDFLDLLFYQFEKNLVKEFNYGKESNYKSNAMQLRNIICIQVESLDSNIVNFKYKGRYIMPFLHKLSAECIYYPYMLAYHYGGGATSDAEFVIINSAIPLENFPTMKLDSYDYPNSIIKRLLLYDYDTKVFHNNVGSYFNRDAAYAKMGFQEFYDLEKMGLKEYGWGAKDEDVMEYIKNKSREQKSPFFYFIITMSSHEPYHSVKNYYRDEFYNDIKIKIVKDYFNSMSYVDKILEDFVSFIKNNTNNTYIFIWGDHTPIGVGSSLFKKSTVEHLELVPLFIVTPDNIQYIENNRIASMLDLASTLLYASGVSFMIKTDGVNLLDFPINEDYIPHRYGQILNRRELFIKLRNTLTTKLSTREDRLR